MTQAMDPIRLFIETGRKKVIAGAVDWPGLVRTRGDEKSAIQAVVEYGTRYARVLQYGKIEFIPPMEPTNLVVVERQAGNATTDFGAPISILDLDRKPVDQKELVRLQEILKACWLAFDHAALQAIGKKLRTGPRGGGRELNQILEHVLGADQEYLAQLGFKPARKAGTDMADQLNDIRKNTMDGTTAASRWEQPVEGPRGGIIWPIRYFFRRAAWHVLDHAWEIEDRLP